MNRTDLLLLPPAIALALSLAFAPGARAQGPAVPAVAAVPSDAVPPAGDDPVGRRKSPALAAALGLVIPGTGHAYIGRWGMAALYFTAHVAGLYSIALTDGDPTVVASTVIVALVSASQAWAGAVEHNRRRTTARPVAASPPEPAPAVALGPQRSVGGAVAMSALVPGAGQLYNRESGGKIGLHLAAGVLATGGTFVVLTTTCPGYSCTSYYGILAGATLVRVWSAWDAGAAAGRFNRTPAGTGPGLGFEIFPATGADFTLVRITF